MKYSKEIIQGLASYIDLQDIKDFIERKNQLSQRANIFNIGSFVTRIIIQKSNIEFTEI